jgi:DMSO/TMAO reductase YedYZ molybdopterin-dependent catalytic subunit
MKTACLYIILLLASFSFHAAKAQQKGATAFIKVTGEVKTPLQLTMADLTKMKAATATLKDRDGADHVYTGVAVQDILNQAGVTTGKELRGENLAKYLLVRCADGYEVAFSLAELDSAFTERTVILAHDMEGKPLAAGKGPFRLVVPGEKIPARSCMQVVEFVIRFAKE